MFLLFFIYIFCDVNICRLTDQCDIAFYLKIVSWHVRTQTVTVCDTSAVSMVMKVYCRRAHLLQCEMKGRVKSTILNGNVTEVVPWHLMYHVTNVPEKARKKIRAHGHTAQWGIIQVLGLARWLFAVHWFKYQSGKMKAQSFKEKFGISGEEMSQWKATA